MLSLSKHAENPGAPQADLPPYVRSQGSIAITAAARDERSFLKDIHESGASRARFPHHAGTALEATLVNIGGGIAGGDQFEATLDVEKGAHALVTTAAAERVYRSLGDASSISTRIRTGSKASAVWLPQELILYQGARLKRSFSADLAQDSLFCMTEIVVLGRTASGERLEDCTLSDIWRIRRDGRLIFADTIALDRMALHHQERPSRLHDKSVFSTSLLVAPLAEEWLESARNLLGEDQETECAASAWNGMLLIRGRARNVFELKNRLAQLWQGLNLFSMPRIWG